MFKYLEVARSSISLLIRATRCDRCTHTLLFNCIYFGAWRDGTQRRRRHQCHFLYILCISQKIVIVKPNPYIVRRDTQGRWSSLSMLVAWVGFTAGTPLGLARRPHQCTYRTSYLFATSPALIEQIIYWAYIWSCMLGRLFFFLSLFLLTLQYLVHRLGSLVPVIYRVA
jgi:hypothetical protein